jgi:stage IV sporulation protein FB
MRDPFTWSIPFGRLFGINIRIHIFFPVVALGLILRAAYQKQPPVAEGAWIDAALVVGLLFFSILLHEFGHCFAARRVGGDAHEVLLWPLGGLANVDVPHSPRAHFLTAAAGPAVNGLLAVGCVVGLLFLGEHPLRPSFDLLGYTARGNDGLVELNVWGSSDAVRVSPYSPAALVAWFFWVNYIGFLFNIVLIGYPMDSGRMLQSLLWPHLGYRQATLAAVFMGFLTVVIVGLAAIVTQEMLALCLALFIYVSCKHQWFLLETGGEESLFGYDFSQGYTSLERDHEAAVTPPVPKLSWWQRWLQRRAQKRAQREQEMREADDRRMDELLEKVQREGIGSLTEEERRFMKRVSDRYRNNRP